MAVMALVFAVAGCKENDSPGSSLSLPPGAAEARMDEAALAIAAAAAAKEAPADNSDLEALPRIHDQKLAPGPDGMIWAVYPSGMMTQDVKVGLGMAPELGHTVVIAYVGKFADTNQEFERVTKESPLRFRLGTNKEIRGLSLGLLGMKPGGKRRVYVPSNLAYGPHGDAGRGIGPNKALVYDVEFMSVSGEVVVLPDPKEAEKMLESIIGPVLPEVKSASPSR